VGDPQATAVATRLVWVAALLLAIGGVLVVLGGVRTDARARARLWTAYATEFGILAVVLIPAYLGIAALLVASLAIAALATAELYATLQAMGATPWTRLGVGLGAASILAAALGGDAWLSGLVFGAAVPLLLGAGTLRRAAGRRTVDTTAATLLGVVYPGVLLAHVLLLERLDGGFGYVVVLFALVEVNDSFALVAGTLVGGPRLWPRISPNKTLVGSLVGLGATMAVSSLLGFAAPAMPAAALVGAGVLVALLGQVGDLVASSIKRDAGIKDFSSLVPAQGGVLDIFDAFIFTAPAFYWYVRWVLASLRPAG
jgi:phosphatidate cytidylyltransferase